MSGIETKFEVVDIQSIISHWVKDYDFEGKNLLNYTWWYDPHKQQVVIVLRIETNDG